MSEQNIRTPEKPVDEKLTEVIKRVNQVQQQSSDAISTVYSEQMEWARHFNELIWTIGSILVPVSLAGFALTLDSETLVWTALASSGLLFFWGLFAEWHRRLWIRSFELTGIIEEKWGLRISSTDTGERTRHLLYFRTPIDWGFYLRWGLILVGLLSWTIKAWTSPLAARITLILLLVISMSLMVLRRPK